MTSQEQIAWAAGLFEGEGHWRVRWYEGTGAVRSVDTCLASTDRDVVLKFRRIVGFGNIRSEQPSNPNAQLQWKWGSGRREEVKQMARQFLPYLGKRRGARAREILKVPPPRIDRKMVTHCPQGHPYDDDNTYWYRKDSYRARHCRTCRRLSDKRRNDKRRNDRARQREGV